MPCMGPSIKISQDTFGTLRDPDTGSTEVIQRFTLENENSVSVQIINYGATITSLKVPSRDGKVSDIVLGFGNLAGYQETQRFFGQTIGRVSNRIRDGKFTVDGKAYQLSINKGTNSLHGGTVGFGKKVWNYKVDGTKLTFSLLSPDGDQGYPGDLIVQVTYELTVDNQLKYEYQAVTTKTTPVALTNHSYFNLAGHENADNKLKGQFIHLNADNYTPLDENLVTTGKIISVTGTVYDLRKMKDLGELLSRFPAGPNGFDNNICINQYDGESIRLVARAQDIQSGRVLEVFSDQPGVQFYTANFLPDPANGDEPIVGKGEAKYWKHGGFCLETQNYPNSVNHANFPNPYLNPGSVYKHKVIYKFYTVQ